MIKLIASDMDGTLLNSLGRLNPEFNSVIKELNNRGIYFACISGRNNERLKKVFKDINEDLIYISDNGNYAEFKGEVLIKNTLNKEIVKNISLELKKLKWCKISYSTTKSIYTEDKLLYNSSNIINYNNKLIKLSPHTREFIRGLGLCSRRLHERELFFYVNFYYYNCMYYKSMVILSI